jgi:hypothetical protein
VAEEQEEPCRREPPDPGDAGEARGELTRRQALEGVEIEPPGCDVAGQGGHPSRPVAETDSLTEPSGIHASEGARPGKCTQLRGRPAGAAERREAGRHPDGAG